MGAEDVPCGVIEGRKIDGPWARPDVRGEDRWADEIGFKVRYSRLERGSAEREDAVLVRLADGAVTGVEDRRNGFDGEDADAGRKAAVEGALEIGCGNRRGERERGDLSERVYAGVGAARALRKYSLAYSAVDGVGEEPLHGGQAGLDLPSVEGRAIVGECELPVSHALLCTVSRENSC